MRVNRKPSGTASTMPAGLAWGGVVAGCITLAGALVTSELIGREVLSWDHSGYAMMIVLMISSWAGSMTAAGKIRRRRLLVCLASGMIYFLLLLAATALFFGGRYSGVGETALLILCGSLLGVFIDNSGKTGSSRTKRRIRNC